MSDAGARTRSARQLWAAPGSSHDRLVAFLRVTLPAAIGVLAAFLLIVPLGSTGDISFLLDKNRVAVAQERLRIQAASYRGADRQGRPFVLSAASGVQHSSAQPIVQLNRLAAQLQMATGQARVVADRGQYDLTRQQVLVEGPVRFTAPDGYRLDTSSATLDLNTRQMASGGAVTGTVPQGNFSAERMHADLEGRTVRLDGNARLRIVPGSAR